MAFDLSTAKPVGGKFDLSTAKPVQSSQPPAPEVQQYGVGDYAKYAARVPVTMAKEAAKGIASLPALAADILVTMPMTLAQKIARMDLSPEERAYLEQVSPSPESATSMISRGYDELAGATGIYDNAPATKAEQYIGAASRGAGAAVSGVGAGRALAESARPAVAAVGDLLSAQPVAQGVAGASSGISGELARDAGLGPTGQAIAATVGGIAGGVATPRSFESAARLAPRNPTPAQAAAGTARTSRELAASAPDMARMPQRRIEPTMPLVEGLGPQPTVEQVAQRAVSKIDLDWGSLDDAIKARVLKNVDDAMSIGSDLPPEAIARKAVYESIGITPTRALITRKFDDALREQDLLASPEGEALRAIYIKNNQSIRENIRGLAGGQPIDEPTFGQQFRAGLESGAKKSGRVTGEFYEKARTAEGGNPVDISGLFDYMKSNRSSLAASGAGKPVISFLKDAGLWGKKAAQAYAKGENVVLDRPMTLSEMTDLRALINAESSSFSTTKNAQRLYGGMRGILDDAEANAGGAAYEQARKVFGRQKSVWEGNPLLVNLLKDKKGFRGVDQVPDEQVFRQAIINSTDKDFATVWARSDSKAKDLTRTQLASYIESKVFSNQGTNEAGDVVASAAKLNAALREINPRKIRAIYGPEKAKMLDRLNTAVREISNPPRGTVATGSAPALKKLYNQTMSVLGLMGRIPVLNVAADVAEKRAIQSANRAAVDQSINVLPMLPPPRNYLLEMGQAVSPLLVPIAATQNQ